MLTKQDLSAINQIISNKIDPIQDKVEIMHTHIRELSNDLSTLNRKLNDVELKVDNLEGETNKRFDKIDKRFDNLEKKMNKRFDKVDKRLGKVEKKLDTAINFLDKDHLRLKKRVTRVKTHLNLSPIAN